MAKIYQKITISVIVLFVAWFVGFIVFAKAIFSYTPLENTNYELKTGITVLTGGRNRIAKAVELLNDKKGERLLISGVKKGTTLQDIISREDIKLKSELPIDLGYKATDTVGNAKEIKEWSDKHNIERIYAVTSFYHIPRTKLELNNFIKNKEIIYISTPSGFVSEQWWKNLRSFTFLAREYTKFLIVFVQYKLLGIKDE